MKLSKIFLVIAIIVVSFLMWVGYQIKPGLYVDAEEYEFDCSQAELIESINDLKHRSGYEIPEYIGIKDGKRDNPYYIIYFYYAQENQLLITAVGNSGGKSKLSFIAVAPHLNLSKWKDINRDFDDKENEIQKRIFQERVVDKLAMRTERK